MSEREDLVERVATAILRRRAQEDYRTADDHGAWVVDHDKELARAAIAECEKERAELEAQCAAMRAALELAFGTDDPDVREAAEAALSPDAGRKVLDVVRAAQDCVAHKEGNYRGQLNGLLLAAKLADALSALG